MERAKREFLDNEAIDIEDVERRLKTRISKAKMPPRTLFKAGLSHSNRLWLELLHAGFSDEQQRIWDKGEDWPGWAELTAEVLR
jgi:hypothetical protein